MTVWKPNSVPSCPIGNLTRADVANISILVQAFDDALAHAPMNVKDYRITQDEWDQIDQLFAELNLPPEYEGDKTWYFYFDGTLLAMFLGYIAYDG